MLKKAEIFIKKHDNIFFIMLITIMTIGINFYAKTENLDEVWCFQNIYKMYNGYKIYIDANAITPPLFWYIGLIMFKIIGPNLLTLRIYNEIILITIATLTYQILKKLKLTKRKAFLSMILIMCLGLYAQNWLMYNGLAIAISLIGILNLIKKETKNQPIIQGIIIFLVTITKQSIGVFYGIGLMIYEIISERKKSEKIKRITKEITTGLIGLFLLIIFLYSQGILEGFINYAILSINEFSRENMSLIRTGIVRILILITGIILSIIVIKNPKIKITQKEKNNIKILAIFSTVTSLMIFPISDEYHSFLGFYISNILLIYLVLEIVAKEMIQEIITNKLKKIVIILTLLIIIFFITINTICIINWAKRIETEKGTPYFGGIMSEEQKENIEKINNYIKEADKKVIVISAKAALYNIPEKRNDGIYDLPLKGNLGKEGEQGLIKRIEKLENTEILIEKDEEKMNWQESKKVREYITKNLKQKGEIEEYSIYETKK